MLASLSESERKITMVCWIQDGSVSIPHDRIKMATIIKLSQNEWVWSFLCKWWEPESEWSESVSESVWKKITKIVWIQDGSVWIQDGSFQDGCHHQFESEWMSEILLCKWWEPIFGKCEWVWEDNTIMAESKMAKFKRVEEFKMAAIIKLSENEWVCSQIELVWVRVRVEWECIWMNLREDNKVSESKMSSVWIKHDRIQDCCHHQVESERMSEVFLVQMVETNLGNCWVT